MSDHAPATPETSAAVEPVQDATVHAAPVDTGTDADTGVDNEVDADAAPADPVTTAVLGCAGVAGVRSVTTDDDALHVRVVVRYGTAVTALGDEVGTALDGLLAGRTLHLDVVDVAA